MPLSKFLQTCTLCIGFSISLLIPATPAMAQNDGLTDAFRRIDLAGRQRMFSQRMSKAACFITTGVEVDKHQAMLASTYDLFDKTNSALSYGSEELGLNLLRIAQPVILALHVVDKRWAEFSPLAKEVIDGGSLDTEGLAGLNASGLALLRDANKAVNKITEVYGGDLPNFPLIMVVTIDLVGRQRMYTQRMSKDFCLIDAGVNVETNIQDLTETLEYFNATMDALIDGVDGSVLPAPTEEIRAKLLEVKELWEAPNTILTAAASGAEISDQDRLVIATEVEKVLSIMNEAALMYEYLVLTPIN